MKIATRLFGAFIICALCFARQASADVVFEEITSQSGMPMGGGGGGKTKVLISGDKYRAQKKLTMDAAAMGDSMKMSQQMGGVNMKMMNQVMRGGKPAYPDHIMTLDEWAEFDENKKLIEEVSAKSKKGKGLLGQLKKEFKPKPGGRGNEEPEKTIEDVLHKYCNELDAGILAKKQDEAADNMAAGGGMGAMALATAVDYETWLRAMIIRDSCGGRGPDTRESAGSSLPPSLRGKSGGGSRAASGPLETLRKVSDDSTPEYKELKRQYELKSEHKAEYARQKEKKKEMAGKMDDMMKGGMAGVAEEVNDMMLSVQIIRLDTGKVIELFPPKNPKDPKPGDVTYKEESLDDVREKAEAQEKKMRKMMKANEGKMKEADAKMAAMRAKYGDSVGGGKPEAKKLANAKINGIPCEHWQITGMSGVDDYWVSKKFAGAEEIMAFEASLKEKTGTTRGGMAFGGMPDTGSMGGMDPVKDAEVAKIKERGIVIKHVNTMKNAAPSQGSMLANQKMMSGDIGNAGAAQMAQSNAALAGMTDKQKAAMMKDPAAMAKMMGGQNIGTAAQASAEKHQAAGDFKDEDRQDMVNTYELRIIGTKPVPAAAFEPPTGAKRK